MAAIMKTGRELPQFARASGCVTHLYLYRLCRRLHFSANCFFGEFGDEKKLASFSPEFLVLTKMSLVLRMHPLVTLRCRRLRQSFLKKEKFAGGNSPGIRDDLQN